MGEVVEWVWNQFGRLHRDPGAAEHDKPAASAIAEAVKNLEAFFGLPPVAACSGASTAAASVGPRKGAGVRKRLARA